MYTITDMPFVIDSATNGIVYRGTVEIPGASTEQLYQRAKAFLWAAFPAQNQIIKEENPATGIIKGNGRLFVTLHTSPMGVSEQNTYYEFPIEIRVADNQYSYQIANINIVNNGVKMVLNRDIRKNLATIRRQTLSEAEYQQAMRSVQPFVQLINQLHRRMRSRAKGPFGV